MGLIDIEERGRDDFCLVKEVSTRQSALATHKKRALIVGSGAMGQALAKSLEAGNHYCVVGFIDDDTRIESGQWPVVGSTEAAERTIWEHAIDEVFLVYAPTWQQRLVEKLAAEHPHIGVNIVPSAMEALMRTGRVEHMGDVAVVRLSDPNGRVWDGIKRLLDFTIAISSLVILSPLLLLAAILVRISSPGPIIFAQERVGQVGKRFILFKFRTMVQDAEAKTGPILASGQSDTRLTAVGRWFRLFRIDELPQFWNVLRGEMSLVGPRPERPCFVERFDKVIPMYGRRHEVRPGITGLAQVCGGYKTDARDKLRFDLIYISHRSLWMDLKILVRTVKVVLSSQGS